MRDEKKYNCLVTGGAGFIGSHVSDYLINDGHKVTILDDLSGTGKSDRNINPKAEFVKGSITNNSLVDSIMNDKDVVYHFAAYAAEGLSHFIRNFNYQNNLIGSTNLINSSVRNGVKTFLFTSSIGVYGKGNPPFDEDHTPSPEDPYGIAKFAVEMDLKNAKEMFDLDYVIIRPHNVYGERQFLGDPYRNVLGVFMNRIMQGKPPLIYGDGKQTRAFSHIDDIAPCIAEAPFTDGALNQIINLGSGMIYTLNDLANTVIKYMGNNVKPEHVPPRNEVKIAHATTSKSERILGFKDRVSLDDGVSRMAKWAKSVGPMDPIIWDEYELTKNLPEFWKNLTEEFPDAMRR
jgi:UDP-glucose 4-epimerase